MLQAVNILFILGTCNINFFCHLIFKGEFFHCRFIYLISEPVHSTLNASDCIEELIFKNLDFFKPTPKKLNVIEITSYM